MKAFDWQRMALDKVPVEFLAEVALRSPDESPNDFGKNH